MEVMHIALNETFKLGCLSTSDIPVNINVEIRINFPEVKFYCACV